MEFMFDSALFFFFLKVVVYIETHTFIYVHTSVYRLLYIVCVYTV